MPHISLLWEFEHNAISPSMRGTWTRVIGVISLICRKAVRGIKLSTFVLSSDVCQAAERCLGGSIPLREVEGSLKEHWLLLLT